ncbi:MAG: hypothetical protein LBB73_03175, partial [Dysgonamonadaceae bacterium]|nr:hypothetical protein [Dysgonamonadaceae bacterium]
FAIISNIFYELTGIYNKETELFFYTCFVINFLFAFCLAVSGQGQKKFLCFSLHNTIFAA